MTKKLLMLSDSESIWTRIIIEQVYKPAGYEVTLFPIWGYKDNSFYRDNGVTVYEDRHTLPVARHIPRLRMWLRIWLNARSLNKLGPFDIVHNNYLSQRDLALGYLVKRRFGARWVAAFWGSDFLRASRAEHARMKPYLARADAVTVDNDKQYEQMDELYGSDIARKTKIVVYGQTSFSAIEHIAAQNDRRACKAHFGIDPDSTVICLGYNASPAQNHIEMLNALAKADCIKSCTIVLQMTYCAPDEDYAERVNAHAKALGLNTLLLTDYMNETESAYLRLAADIYIHCIKTDSFSASMCEYLCAGTVTLCGAWLPYPMLTDMGIHMHMFDSPDALPALVDSAAAGELEPVPPELRKKLADMHSWEALRQGWIDILAGAAGVAGAVPLHPTRD